MEWNKTRVSMPPIGMPVLVLCQGQPGLAYWRMSPESRWSKSSDPHVVWYEYRPGDEEAAIDAPEAWMPIPSRDDIQT